MRWFLILAGLLAAVAVASFALSLVGDTGGRRADELPTSTATLQTLEQTTVAIGTVEPRVGAEVRVGSQVSGVVERLAVEIGDRVERGDLLVTLRDEAQRVSHVTFAGVWLVKRFETQAFYKVVYVLIFVVGLYLVWEGLAGAFLAPG